MLNIRERGVSGPSPNQIFRIEREGERETEKSLQASREKAGTKKITETKKVGAGNC